MEGFPKLTASRTAGRNSTALLAILVFAASVAAYAITLRNGFVWDDMGTLTGVGTSASAADLWRVIVQSISGPIEGAGYYRPLIGIIHTLVRIAVGDGAWGFHLLNIAVHAGVTVAAFAILLMLLAGSAPPTLRDRTLACAGALLFSLHPVHTESVAWASGITDPAFSLFYLIAFLFYLMALRPAMPASHRVGLTAISLVSFLLGALAKEPGLTLPFLLIAHDKAFPERLPSRSPAGYLGRHLPYLATAAIYLLLRYHALSGLRLGGQSQRLPLVENGATLDTLSYAISALPLFVKYLATLLAPVNLSAYHEVRTISTLSEPRAILSLLVTLLFVFILWMAVRKNRPLFFALSTIVIPLLPALNFRATGTTAFAERYLYLPVFGLVLALVFTAADLWKKKSERGWLLATVCAMILACYTAATIPRNTVWRDNYTLWSDTVRHYPDSAIARYNLAHELKQAGRLQEAIDQYRAAVSLAPELADAHMNLGNIYAVTGLPDIAISEYRTTLRIRPDYAEAHLNLGRVLLTQGKTDEAITSLGRSVTINPENPMARNALGMAFQQRGAMERAREEFREAVRLNPGNRHYRVNLANALGNGNNL